MTDKLRQLIEGSDRILITSHISTDPDAFCSVLLISRILNLNFPDKTVSAVLEEKPTKDLGFLKDAELVKFNNLSDEIKAFKPDLLIIADANQFKRCSRTEFEEIADFVRDSNIKTAIIDHHQPIGADKADLYIRRDTASTTQLIYELFFDELGLKKPVGYAPTAMLGIITDTIRFKVGIADYDQTFAIVNQLIKDGADIEELENKITQFDPIEISALGHIAGNLVVDKGYNYSFVSDEFFEQHSSEDGQIAVKSAAQLFVNEFIRNIGRNDWGFLARPEEEGLYAVSFRAKKGVKNVSEVAAKLGGGGHIGAAAARIEATSITEAVDKVKAAINTLA